MKTDRETAIVGTESEISYTALGWNPQEKRRLGVSEATRRRTAMKERQLNRTENFFKLGDNARNRFRSKTLLL